jgi:hypothetical protein
MSKFELQFPQQKMYETSVLHNYCENQMRQHAASTEINS